MSALVLELQREALNTTGSVSNLLRMAFLVARKLDVTDFEKWIDSELNGYQDGAEIPSYRKLRGALKVRNPFHGWQPLFVQDAKQAEMFSKFPSMQSIGEIESFLVNENGSQGGSRQLVRYFPPKIENMLMEGMSGPMMQPAIFISTSLLQGIVETVRTTVLDWSLKLEKAGILGQDMTFSNDEKALATAAQITYQVQNQTVIHSMNQSQFQQGTTDSVQIVVQPPPDVAVINDIVKELRAHLDSFNLDTDIQAEVLADIATIEAQQGSPKPRFVIIKEALRSVRTVLESTISNAAGTALPGILEKIGNLLS